MQCTTLDSPDVLVQDVVLIATRRIMRPPEKGSAAVRPRSRTLTAVHEAILDDLVYPTEIVASACAPARTAPGSSRSGAFLPLPLHGMRSTFVCHWLIFVVLRHRACHVGGQFCVGFWIACFLVRLACLSWI